MQPSLGRREFLAVLAALGGATALAQSRPRIDLHHHFAAPPCAKRHAEVKRQGWQVWNAKTP